MFASLVHGGEAGAERGALPVAAGFAFAFAELLPEDEAREASRDEAPKAPELLSAGGTMYVPCKSSGEVWSRNSCSPWAKLHLSPLLHSPDSSQNEHIFVLYITIVFGRLKFAFISIACACMMTSG